MVVRILSLVSFLLSASGTLSFCPSRIKFHVPSRPGKKSQAVARDGGDDFIICRLPLFIAFSHLPVKNAIILYFNRDLF